MKILLTGGSGKLGAELQELRKFDYVPTHDEMDFTDPKSIADYAKGKRIDLIAHCGGYTDTAKAEQETKLCFASNGYSVQYLLGIIKAPLLYISSEYADESVGGVYAQSKRFGELYATKSLRLLFKSRPFPYEEAFYDQWTSGDYVDVIAKEVSLAIDLYDHLPKLTCIGTGRKSIYHLAMETNPDVVPVSRMAMKGYSIPYDTSMDCSDWERIKVGNSEEKNR